LRTPMTSIRAFSEILMDGPRAGKEAQVKYSSIIHDETMRLTRLLDDLLDLSVLENGSVSLNFQRARLQDVLGRAVSATATLRVERVIDIIRDETAEAIDVTTDIDRLRQVFINLIANARKYCDATNPELRIIARQRGGTVQIDFIDNGSGIPKKSQIMIFEKFSRLSDQTAAGGAGLGLAICREIMNNLGGQIAYLPGQGGTAFRVTLPTEMSKAKAAE
jgi:signal transduction histidine kinase